MLASEFIEEFTGIGSLQKPLFIHQALVGFMEVSPRGVIVEALIRLLAPGIDSRQKLVESLVVLNCLDMEVTLENLSSAAATIVDLDGDIK